jgi:opacity protein-like surface antigen
MVSVKVASVAGFVALLATAASAADMPQPPPIYIPQIEEISSGWYLRGDIGMSNQRVKSLHNVLYNTATVTSAHRLHRRVSRQDQLPRLRHREDPWLHRHR